MHAAIVVAVLAHVCVFLLWAWVLAKLTCLRVMVRSHGGGWEQQEQQEEDEGGEAERVVVADAWGARTWRAARNPDGVLMIACAP